MLRTTGLSPRFFLIAGIISALYFGLLASNVLQNVDFVLLGVFIELFTIPMILVQFGIIGYTAYSLFIEKTKPSVGLIIGFIIAVVIAVSVVYSFL